ncbi:type II toxin-antitoxin system Phd/YefM family antitoxin [Pendulispora brunnea]|uniref:type II toxin-antitoxin system Phd/YefM family antitoxin n=1 Tax=Pendulispora brunnea TaxID=2905690 RepID=UPI00374DFE48
MKVVTVHEAKTHLSRLIEEVLEGEEVAIARGTKGHPIVRLCSRTSPQTKAWDLERPTRNQG